MTCESAEVSLLNGFRDLTLMGVQVRKCCEIRNVCFLILPTDSADSVFHHAHGVIATTNVALPWYRQAFDFNHMNNVLISRDCRKARLIDIDGNSKGSIQPLSWTSKPSFFFCFSAQFAQFASQDAPRAARHACPGTPRNTSKEVVRRHRKLGRCKHHEWSHMRF